MSQPPDASVSTIIQEDNHSAYFTWLWRRPNEMRLQSSLHHAQHVLSTQNVLIMHRVEIITKDFVLMGEPSREAGWWRAQEQAKGLSLRRSKPVI